MINHDFTITIIKMAMIMIITIMLFKGWQVSQQDSLGNWGWIGEPGVKVTCFAVLNKFQFWSQKRDKQQETGEKKMAIILPTGQWYAPSAVINDAWYCMVLHCIA